MMIRLGGLTLGVVLLAAVAAGAADQPQWGQGFTRNMVSGETGLIEDFDPATGKNVKWVVSLGSETWATPVVAQGRVFIGTNNDPPRDPRNKGDRGVLLCLDEKDGSLRWQLVVPKLGPDIYLDWPRSGLVAPATVEGNRVYVVTNRDEVVCLDIEGQSNGNDGPYRDEGRHMVPKDQPALEVTPLDADIIWLYDIPNQAGTWPHDGAHGSILIDGDFLYVNTSNGKDNTHRRIRCPDGPSLIVLDKKTGRLLARDREGIGPRIFHSTWSSPTLGVVNGRKLIFFCGGDGVVYAFEPLSAGRGEGAPPSPAGSSEGKERGQDALATKTRGQDARVTEERGQDALDTSEVQTLKRVWRFECDPTGPKENVSEYMGNRDVSPSNIKSMPVFVDNRLYVTVGGDIWWGKNKAWLQCIDATGTGDITAAGLVWSCDLKDHCCSTPAVQDGLVFVADCGRLIHCIDAATGRELWSHDAGADMWASTLVADGKVYVGTNRGDFWVLAAGREKRVISTLRLDSDVAGTPTAANGVLYVATMRKLYALRKTP
jgi:outer membrane protein assembly factor BamB